MNDYSDDTPIEQALLDTAEALEQLGSHLETLPYEEAAPIVRAMLRKNPHLITSKVFVRWAAKNRPAILIDEKERREAIALNEQLAGVTSEGEPLPDTAAQAPVVLHEMDEFDWHEALDRVALMSDMFDRHVRALIAVRLTPEIAARADYVAQMLGEMYQLIGVTHLGDAQ